MRVLITGATGQLGTDLVRTCQEAGDEVVACGRNELDLTDRDSVLGAITSTRPEVVLNAGAWTAVDACEVRSRSGVPNQRDGGPVDHPGGPPGRARTCCT